ncbi:MULTISPECIES: hypothetical protein [Sutcliffiella]|uniref:Uncharacterized protein n=1 Tax=Sutcliffiella cohnii TaxID=33932 RepID=A0A223KP38_9BACI|nr:MULTISPECIES: hypothetical protein [Sutcliffiella]AST91219.1 hypothetical protein BC6307_07970 [Sutcliffiella cohnii]MED4018824.1 hypothetical protein [Sutcliffiella cohnii]WBL17036.1 hypothetical protein O1A01_10555 [Sutcliffiella sp. NC1]
MKLKTLSSKIAIIVSSVTVALCIVFASQAYFSYQEVKSLADGCYDKGGLPSIQKTGFTVKHFSCNLDG